MDLRTSSSDAGAVFLSLGCRSLQQLLLLRQLGLQGVQCSLVVQLEELRRSVVVLQCPLQLVLDPST